MEGKQPLNLGSVRSNGSQDSTNLLLLSVVPYGTTMDF